MHELLAGFEGTRLIGDAYWNDVNTNFWKTDQLGFWKLERLQSFQEPSDASWRAFAEGDWNAALELLEQRRPELEQHYARIADAGFETRRVRVVEHPINDYTQWELQLLNLRNELGGHARVIDSAHVAEFEKQEMLPELITLGDSTMYRLLYDEEGLQEGGVRYQQPELIGRCREFIQKLYGRGEDIEPYFRRHVAGLEPPVRSR